MDKHFLRAFIERKAEEPGEAGQAITFVASAPGVKRDGKDLEVGKWQLENYQRNPVFLWAHDYMGRNLPIGRSEVHTEGKQLMAEVNFDQADEFARQVEDKYRRGFLNAVSVGWLDEILCKHCGEKLNAWQSWGLDIMRKKCPHCEKELREGDIDVRYELLDISGVPVPGDPDALMEREYRALSDYFDKDGQDKQDGGKRGAIPPHSTAKADEDMGWDGPGEVAKAEGAGQLRRMHAWVDDEGDAETKQAYKLPHHLAEDGKVVWRGVAAAMGRLLQAGTQIPDGDRRGVYNHLARHYSQFDKEAPEFRTLEELAGLGEEEIRGLFLEGEGDLIPNENRGWSREELERAMELIRVVLEKAEEEGGHEEAAGSGDEYDEDAIEYLEALRVRLSLGGLS